MGPPSDADSAGDTNRSLESVPAPQRRRLAASTALRCVLFATSIIFAYWLIPFRGEGNRIVLRAAIGVVVLLAVLVTQLRAIATARYPQLKVVEAFAVAIPLTLVVFSGTYLTMSGSDSSAFSEELNHVSALYFTMTSMTTIGFGDVSPSSDAARIAAMVQMVANITVIAVGTRLAIRMVKNTLKESDES